jgi:hypothetical protein
MAGSHLVATGNIGVSCFVTFSGDDQGAQATANAPLIGIAGEGSNQAPLSDLVSTNYAAASGENFKLYGPDQECLVVVGAAITYGQRLKSDANGNAVPIATTGTVIQECGAIALESSSVKVQLDRILPATM